MVEEPSVERSINKCGIEQRHVQNSHFPTGIIRDLRPNTRYWTGFGMICPSLKDAHMRMFCFV
jgi:hypothetical protein